MTRAESIRVQYATGASIAKVARRLGLRDETVRRELLRSGVKMRSSGFREPPDMRTDDVDADDTAARCTCGLRVDKDHTPETCDMRGGAMKYARRAVDLYETY